MRPGQRVGPRLRPVPSGSAVAMRPPPPWITASRRPGSALGSASTQTAPRSATRVADLGDARGARRGRVSRRDGAQRGNAEPLLEVADAVMRDDEGPPPNRGERALGLGRGGLDPGPPAPRVGAVGVGVLRVERRQRLGDGGEPRRGVARVEPGMGIERPLVAVTVIVAAVGVLVPLLGGRPRGIALPLLVARAEKRPPPCREAASLPPRRAAASPRRRPRAGRWRARARG